MTIIDSCTPNAKLAQGDILKGVALSYTSEILAQAGSFKKVTSCNYCLVLSRECAIEHKPMVLVAAITKLDTDKLPRDADVKKTLEYLTFLRENPKMRDQFYIGQLPNETGRFSARFDSIHTLDIPADIRESIISTKRIGRLSPDLIRHLQTKLFDSVASTGFDDHRWFSTNDLLSLTTKMQAELDELQRSISGAEATKAAQIAAGERYDETQLVKDKTTHNELTEKYSPYFVERDNRSINEEPASNTDSITNIPA